MQAIEPIRITAGNFAAYGRYYNLRGEDGARLADGRTAISRSSAAECDRDGARQILCACGAVKLTVMLRGRPESVYTVRLSRGDYALLEENVCYKVLREPGTPGYYYILSPKGLM